MFVFPGFAGRWVKKKMFRTARSDVQEENKKNYSR